MAKYWTS